MTVAFLVWLGPWGIKWGKKKPNKHKEFWRDTPWCVSRLSRGNVPSVPSYVPSVPRTFWPLNWNFHINRPKRPGCPWDVPNLSLGRFRGIPTTKFLYVIFFNRFFSLPIKSLVAPYCAIPRDYLSDTPLLRAMGFLVSQHGELGAIPPPPFLSVSPLESMRSGGAIPPPPPSKGVSQRYLRDTL